ncbi:hypothetical protein Pse7367_0424 [Thalassoporum mexicanum PCC 7367]|uniref:HEPN domain-containing protein n=1 Tax=Thalassoporum mexicanum TaxID=3457544 RepID=UPI00029F9CEE|nr:HEPN domain-containing protein [Pseudanabaena sp. PCC 7367]AFY68735.1 hypothetical protein Pse7367_0424 [Pseudanabaena sp. PCC 7367]
MASNSQLYLITAEYLDQLKLSILDAQTKLAEGDEFLLDHATFLINSFIVLACTYIETYIKDAFDQCVDKFNQSLDDIKIPSSIIVWATNTEKYKKKDRSPGQYFKIEKNKAYKDYIASISGNIEKTISCFKILDLDLTTSEQFENLKPQIGTFIENRNIIVHRNQSASFTFGDLAKRIEVVKEYLAAIDEVIMSKDYLN